MPAKPFTPTAANRLGLDYRAEAVRLGPPVTPIIDAHAHINGPKAAVIYKEVRDLYGVNLTYSQTRIEDGDAVRDALADTVRFVAVPRWMHPDRKWAHTMGYLEDIPVWREKYGSRMAKFWTAPRLLDYTREMGDPKLLALDGEWRRRQMRLCTELGMMIMVHIADPDTWFKTKYADPSFYGTKERQYLPIERLVDEFTQPWLLAHMAGWPEDLDFLDGLLSRHPNIVIDTSATKWMVRELSKLPAGRFAEFLQKHQGRVLFGSDIVTMEQHLAPKPTGLTDAAARFAEQAHSKHEAFDLYASRYWALRTMFETGYDGESPIADPDLALVEPMKHDEMSAPALRGMSLPRETLRTLYRGACEGTLERWWLDR